ncbi:kunitz-type protease inhibitor 1b [Paramisgurnus dabryanus]|uniref:kunitz-type protease inhibitor 1b n=1 Tax=Paramisgurnus dabryanus TaxID=90735 RepID=UPI0031F39490
MASCCFVFVVLLQILAVYGEGTESDASGHEKKCEKEFIAGRQDFVLDSEDSIKHGATYLDNPSVNHMNECVAACCSDAKCNVALIEQGQDEESVTNCFLFSCLYKQKYVCRFIKNSSFTTYILKSVYEHYLNRHTSDETDKPPIANAGPDVVVQPKGEVLLNGIESWDDQKIISYSWTLAQGDPSVVMEKTNLEDQIKVTNLIPGVYGFKLTVTDSAHHSDSAQVTVLVLTPEQSEHHCLIPKKVGPCRGSFLRWHYNAASSSCEEFIFGGCKQNRNNYLSEKECSDACKDTKAIDVVGPRKGLTEDCSSPCNEDQFTCSNGCCLKKEVECDGQMHCSDGSDEASCVKVTESLSQLLVIKADNKAGCTDPPNTGPCRAHFPRWYYDPANQKCHRFTYGGCENNHNNFEKQDDCLEQCSGVTENDVFARVLHNVRDSELGESQSASVALAVVLVVAILAMLAVLGYCFFKNKRKNGEHQRVATSNPTVAYSDDAQVYNSTTSKA